MSFMFHPYPYVDRNAVNILDVDSETEQALICGALPVAREIARLFKAGHKRIAVDGFPGAPFEMLTNLLHQQLGQTAPLRDARSLLRPAQEIRAIIADCLPEDREIDPVLLYGRIFEGSYKDLQQQEAVQEALKQKELILIGQGALSEELRDSFDLRMWLDISPRQAVLNFKNGCARNLGEPAALPYGAMMRRNYYVDFELAIHCRWSLIRQKLLHCYLSADDAQGLSLLPFEQFDALLNLAGRRPLRCRPVYLEGVWGGFYMKRLRRLPDNMRNCAWIFDLIPMEVSLALGLGKKELEIPFFTFVQHQGQKLLGEKAYRRFGGYFPVRFNYDDTFHAGGNMSIQCHPGEEYLVREHRELGRQDESYYVCVAGEGAQTYLGFRQPGDKEAFLSAAREAEKTGRAMDYERYLHAVPSKPGTQVMIPAGTVHASGRNQVVLEIGSLTMGSYTYKLYDYQREDPNTGLKRPIHLKAGALALKGERTEKWVSQNLVNHGGVLREEEGFRETVAGEHELLYFSLRTLHFDREMPDDTQGCFHVLVLTEGERVRVESLADPSRSYLLHYLDIVVVPASLGAYRLINLGEGGVTVHKTTLKE